MRRVAKELTQKIRENGIDKVCINDLSTLKEVEIPKEVEYVLAISNSNLIHACPFHSVAVSAPQACLASRPHARRVCLSFVCVRSLNSILSNLSETDTALFNSCYQLLQRSLKVKKTSKRKSTDTRTTERAPQAKRSVSRPKVESEHWLLHKRLLFWGWGVVCVCGGVVSASHRTHACCSLRWL